MVMEECAVTNLVPGSSHEYKERCLQEFPQQEQALAAISRCGSPAVANRSRGESSDEEESVASWDTPALEPLGGKAVTGEPDWWCFPSARLRVCLGTAVFVALAPLALGCLPAASSLTAFSLPPPLKNESPPPNPGGVSHSCNISAPRGVVFVRQDIQQVGEDVNNRNVKYAMGNVSLR
ncbi:unnamed protein product [Pleuronectes platessa]|uniref:Uncharacterized protein n=1 Tax=Pleuronectes platessa TaxID=8262 RepID=A0A9N7VV79_PLEPL|nr:unnamed protein product [Pleuronectes platessa]